MVGMKKQKRGSLKIPVRLLARILVIIAFIFYTLFILNNLEIFGRRRIFNRTTAATTLFTVTDNEFCKSLTGALAQGPEGRTMIHAFVSNSGHFPFLHNVLLGMIRMKTRLVSEGHSFLPWKPLVLAIGAGVCPMLANVKEVQGHYVCVPYIERLFHQLQRDEPESVEQIQSKLIPHNNTSEPNNNHHRFHGIDNTFYGWGGVEHKFLINSKLYALRDILECGPDAFITDTDVAFRKDPRPFFDIQGPKGDIVAQDDTNDSYQLSLNSGFMYWRRTPQNLDLIHDIITVPPFWHIDQSRVNTRMYNRSTPHTLLDRYSFPNGNMFLNKLDKLNDMIVFHANWNDRRERKQEMLEKVGLWYLEKLNCSSYAIVKGKVQEKQICV